MNSSYSEGLITPGSPLTSYRPKNSPSITPGPACVCVASRNSLEESKSDNFVLMIFCNFCCVCRRINNKSQDTMIACSLTPLRSEEHTSELQSRPHLVCRLLLET